MFLGGGIYVLGVLSCFAFYIARIILIKNVLHKLKAGQVLNVECHFYYNFRKANTLFICLIHTKWQRLMFSIFFSSKISL